MILIKNRQKKIVVNTNQLERDAQAVLKLLKYEDFDLGILITTNSSIRAYNRDYRHKDKPTDVLSFPYHPELVAGRRIRVRSEEDKNLGDIIISAEYVVKEAEKYQVTFEQRMRVLLVHGVCHLLGYDHIEDRDWRRMRAKEAFLLRKLASS
jgi:probable rRNA maturation factor